MIRRILSPGAVRQKNQQGIVFILYFFFFFFFFLWCTWRHLLDSFLLCVQVDLLNLTRILLKEIVYRFNHLPSWGWLFWVIDWHWMATRWWWRDCEMIEKKFDFLCICFWQSGFQCQSTLVRLFYDMMMMVMHWFFKEISSTNNITLLYNIVVVVVRLETFQKRNTKRKRVERNRDPATTSSTGKKWRRKSNKRKERKKERKKKKEKQT